MDGVQQAEDPRVGTHPHGLAKEQVGRASLLDERSGARSGQRQWLLAQDVLAGGEAGADVLDMAAVRGGHVDHVDLRVGEERLVGAVGSTPVLGGERPGRLLGTGTHSHKLGVGHQREVGGEGVRDATGGQDPPAHRAVGVQQAV